MLDLQNRYNLTDIDTGYQFTTENDITYYLTFFDYPIVDNYLQSNIYSFAVERNRDDNLHGLNSDRVRTTILYTISLFFEKNQDALIAIYDITDNRQDARRRLFNSWYNKYNDSNMDRLSATFLIQDKTTGADLFFLPEHPEKLRFKEVFEILKGDNFYC